MEHASAFLNLFLPDTYMTNDCVSITKTLVMGEKINDRQVLKNT